MAGYIGCRSRHCLMQVGFLIFMLMWYIFIINTVQESFLHWSLLALWCCGEEKGSYILERGGWGGVVFSLAKKVHCDFLILKNVMIMWWVSTFYQSPVCDNRRIGYWMRHIGGMIRRKIEGVPHDIYGHLILAKHLCWDIHYQISEHINNCVF